MLEYIPESPLDYKEIQPVHQKISPEYSLERLMLKLKLQHFGHLIRNPWLIHFNVWQNPLQYCKVISLQLIIKKKRKEGRKQGKKERKKERKRERKKERKRERKKERKKKRKPDSFEKTLMLGEIEGRRRRGWQRLRWSDGIADSMDMSLCSTAGLACYSPWGHKGSNMPEQLNWTDWSNQQGQPQIRWRGM